MPACGATVSVFGAVVVVAGVVVVVVVGVVVVFDGVVVDPVEGDVVLVLGVVESVDGDETTIVTTVPVPTLPRASLHDANAVKLPAVLNVNESDATADATVIGIFCTAPVGLVSAKLHDDTVPLSSVADAENVCAVPTIAVSGLIDPTFGAALSVVVVVVPVFEFDGVVVVVVVVVGVVVVDPVFVFEGVVVVVVVVVPVVDAAVTVNVANVPFVRFPPVSIHAADTPNVPASVNVFATLAVVPAAPVVTVIAVFVTTFALLMSTRSHDFTPLVSAAVTENVTAVPTIAVRGVTRLTVGPVVSSVAVGVAA